MMSTKPLRNLTRLSLYLSTIRPSTKITRHAPWTPYLRTLTRYERHPMNVVVSRQVDNQAKTKFTKSDVPPLSFWETYVQPPLVPTGAISPEACHDACQQYVTLALERQPNWQQRCPPLYALQYVALVLMNTTGSTALAMHILQTGVGREYVPSILTVGRLAYMAGGIHTERFADVKEALKRLSLPNEWAIEKSDVYRADVLTLSGLIASSLQTPKDDVRALKLFDWAAAAFASSDDATWVWHASAVLEQSKIRQRQKRPDLARAVLDAHMDELDNAEVFYAYAMLLPLSDPERVPLLERAAVSACVPAALEMGRVESMRASEPGLSERERQDRRILADEWFRIAGGKATT